MVTRLLLVLFVCCVRAMNYVVYVLQAILTLLLLLCCVFQFQRLYFCFAKKNRESKTFRFYRLAETKKEHVSSEMAYTNKSVHFFLV